MNKDFSLTNHGSIVSLRPLTPAASNWVEYNLPEDRQEFGGAVIIEPRYISPIIDGIVDDGLTVEGG